MLAQLAPTRAMLPARGARVLPFSFPGAAAETRRASAPLARGRPRRVRSAIAAAGKNEIPPAMPLVTVVEPETDRELLCMLRRRFKLANGEERCLCLPLDHPVDVLRGEGLDESEDLSDIGDEELLQIIPDMAAALAQKGMLLQRSAFCMTVRGAVRFNETDALMMDTGLDEASEGVEVVTFTSGASRYLVYAPMNPVLLVTREREGTHEVMFDEEMDDDALEENLAAVEEELRDEDDELFEDMGLGLFEEEEESRGGRGGGGGRGARGGRGKGRGRKK